LRRLTTISVRSYGLFALLNKYKYLRDNGADTQLFEKILSYYMVESEREINANSFIGPDNIEKKHLEIYNSIKGKDKEND